MSEVHSSKIVLIVCDDSIDKTLWRLIFTRMNFNILEARGIDTILPLLDTKTPDLIMLGFWLHGKMTGVELCAVLRQRTDTDQTPILLASARSDQESIDIAMRAGVTRYISIPFNSHDFMKTVESLLN